MLAVSLAGFPSFGTDSADAPNLTRLNSTAQLGSSKAEGSEDLLYYSSTLMPLQSFARCIPCRQAYTLEVLRARLPLLSLHPNDSPVCKLELSE